jgi:hypothetical protein
MASAISAKAITKKIQFQILRSIYYNQALPKEVLHRHSADRLSAEISALSHLKLIRRDAGKFTLTELGRGHLFRISGNRKPPMVDLDESLLIKKNEPISFLVRSSLAAEIYSEVSNGE